MIDPQFSLDYFMIGFSILLAIPTLFVVFNLMVIKIGKLMQIQNKPARNCIVILNGLIYKVTSMIRKDSTGICSDPNTSNEQIFAHSEEAETAVSKGCGTGKATPLVVRDGSFGPSSG
jgi:hypothetical protein